MSYLVDKNRISKIRREEFNPGLIAYWMTRDQRINDNWSLLYALQLANKYKMPVTVFFNLLDEYSNATDKIFSFMIRGLEDISKRFADLNIPFFIIRGEPKHSITEFVDKYDIKLLITDFDPLKQKRHWLFDVKMNNRIPIYRVDTHNIIPFNKVSDKQEYSAYTMRKKVRKNLKEYLTDFPAVRKCEFFDTKILNEAKINNSKFFENYTYSDGYDIDPGEKSAFDTFEDFINSRFLFYNKLRNDPTENMLSGLSPYLHFGHISSQRIALEINKLFPDDHEADGVDAEYLKSKKSFLEELIVRKELSDNFCYYNNDYDNYNGFPNWAKETLNKHREDVHEYIYTIDDFENAETHDKYWNAAQIQMIKTGKMHGYMRMYWAKKILEWTESPEQAQETAITLNDKYELDGRDPNGYTGIAWSIGGVHDKPWAERHIFGKIRYMNANGLKRKFNIDKYADKYSNL